MKRLVRMIMLVALLLQVFSAAALANDGGDPVGGCPGRFVLHNIMDHDGDPEHHAHHIGIDRNADGWICVKHGDQVHLHIDNKYPL